MHALHIHSSETCLLYKMGIRLGGRKTGVISQIGWRRSKAVRRGKEKRWIIIGTEQSTLILICRDGIRIFGMFIFQSYTPITSYVCH